MREEEEKLECHGQAIFLPCLPVCHWTNRLTYMDVLIFLMSIICIINIQNLLNLSKCELLIATPTVRCCLPGAQKKDGIVCLPIPSPVVLIFAPLSFCPPEEQKEKDTPNTGSNARLERTVRQSKVPAEAQKQRGPYSNQKEAF